MTQQLMLVKMTLTKDAKKEELIEFAQSSFRQKKSHYDHKKRRGITSSVKKENKNRELDIDKDIEKNI